MVLRWDEGRATVDRMLLDGRLQRVSPSRDYANELMAKADRKLASAVGLLDSDPDTAFTVAYDASRFALTAILAVQGLRPKTDGGHIAVHEALLAQFPSMASRLRPFDRLRRTRNDRQYPALGALDIARADVEDDIELAKDLIEFARPLIAEMPVL